MGMYDRNVVGKERETNISTFSSRVYGWMAIGLGVTATIAYFLYATGAYAILMPYWWIWSLGTLGCAFAITSAIGRISIQGAIALFLTYAALEGMLFGSILPAYAA